MDLIPPLEMNIIAESSLLFTLLVSGLIMTLVWHTNSQKVILIDLYLRGIDD